MSEHTFLVAIAVDGDVDRATAERFLHNHLPATGEECDSADGETYGASLSVAEWWIAEDDRRDRSDNESAVFVPHHLRTKAARSILEAAR